MKLDCCFVAIALVDFYLPVSRPSVQRGKHCGLPKAVDTLVHTRKSVQLIDADGSESSVIGAKVK